METRLFSYHDILNLCRQHEEEILSQHKAPYNMHNRLSGLLMHRKVRFINPMGQFDYTEFGHFYFDSMGVMMLITIEKKYTPYHRPDLLLDSLWSTVPVIYAGVDTRCDDDCRQRIFTGDVVTADGFTSVVRYMHPDIPGLAGDNCDFQFRPDLKLHKEGTIFCDVSYDQYHVFDYSQLMWPTEQFCPGGMRPDEVKEKASKAADSPIFLGEAPRRKVIKRTYHDSLASALGSDGIMVYLRDKDTFEDEDGEPNYCIYCDDVETDFQGEHYEISMGDSGIIQNDLKEGIEEFLLHAHRNPDKKYVLCDFAGILRLSDYQRQKVARLFYDWLIYNIPNVLIPSRLFLRVVSYEGIGRD